MASIITLPTAAAQPVVNPKRKGRRARGGKVTLACDLVTRRYRREQGLREAALAPAAESERTFSPLEKAELCERMGRSMLRDAEEYRRLVGRGRTSVISLVKGGRHG